jgi:hypothetical protein
MSKEIDGLKLERNQKELEEKNLQKIKETAPDVDCVLFFRDSTLTLGILIKNNVPIILSIKDDSPFNMLSDEEKKIYPGLDYFHLVLTGLTKTMLSTSNVSKIGLILKVKSIYFEEMRYHKDLKKTIYLNYSYDPKTEILKKID